MTHEVGQHDRRSVRIAGYDYLQSGMYFVTVCTVGRACVFGEVADGEMRLNASGRMAKECWVGTPVHFPHLILDVFVVMPNHVHGILVIADSVGATHASPVRTKRERGSVWSTGPKAGAVGVIVGSFKSATSRRINIQRSTPGATVWQRNYYEHIIRDGKSLDRIRRYIAENLARWAFDRENPQAVNPEPEDAWRALDRNEDRTR